MTELSSPTLDPARQAQARRYALLRRRLMVVDLALSALYAGAWLALGWSAALKAALLRLTTHEWLWVAAYAAIFGGLYLVLDLPLSYYEGFVLPHRFGLATQRLSGWVVDQLKALALGAVLGLLLLEVIYALLRAAPQTWWLWAGGLLIGFNVLLTHLAPVLIFPLFNKFEPLGAEHAGLVERLTRLAEQAGTRVGGVYRFDMSRRTRAANAALIGWGRTRRIIVGDTLLAEFTPDEIETVLAHELGHHVHRDILWGIVVESALTLGGLYGAAWGLRWGAAALGFAGPADVAALPLFGLVMGGYGLVTLPLSNTYSRWRERLADRYALRLTGKGAAFAAAFTRLANQNLAEVEPEPWVEFLLYSHPALHKRIALAEAYERVSA